MHFRKQLLSHFVYYLYNMFALIAFLALFTPLLVMTYATQETALWYLIITIMLWTIPLKLLTERRQILIQGFILKSLSGLCCKGLYDQTSYQIGLFRKQEKDWLYESIIIEIAKRQKRFSYLLNRRYIFPFEQKIIDYQFYAHRFNGFDIFKPFKHEISVKKFTKSKNLSLVLFNKQKNTDPIKYFSTLKLEQTKATVDKAKPYWLLKTRKIDKNPGLLMIDGILEDQNDLRKKLTNILIDRLQNSQIFDFPYTPHDKDQLLIMFDAECEFLFDFENGKWVKHFDLGEQYSYDYKFEIEGIVSGKYNSEHPICE